MPRYSIFSQNFNHFDPLCSHFSPFFLDCHYVMLKHFRVFGWQKIIQFLGVIGELKEDKLRTLNIWPEAS